MTLMAAAWAPVPFAAGFSSAPVPHHEALRQEAERLLDDAEQRLEGRCRLSRLLREEELTRAILSRVAAAEHDAVVLAADALREPRWPFTSRGTAALLRRANVPFLIVPTRR